MKSSLREKKRIKEDARHLPPVRRWFSLSATALSHCETPHFIPAVPEWPQEAVQLGTSVRKLILPLWLPRSRGLPCMPHSAAKPEAPLHALKQDITQRKNLYSALARTPPLSYMPPGKTTLKVCQLDWRCHASQTSSYD